MRHWGKMMRCLGRTKSFQRCKRDEKGLFCRQHRWQPYAFALSTLSLIGLLAGVYQDLWKPACMALFVEDNTGNHSEDASLTTPRLSIRYSGIRYGIPRRCIFHVDHKDGHKIQLESVRIVFTQRRGSQAWDMGPHSRQDFPDFSFGPGIVIGHCSELVVEGFSPQMETGLSIDLFEQGQTRTFFLDFPPDLFRQLFGPKMPIKSRIEICAQGEVIASESTTEWLNHKIWSGVFRDTELPPSVSEKVVYSRKNLDLGTWDLSSIKGEITVSVVHASNHTYYVDGLELVRRWPISDVPEELDMPDLRPWNWEKKLVFTAKEIEEAESAYLQAFVAVERVAEDRNYLVTFIFENEGNTIASHDLSGFFEDDRIEVYSNVALKKGAPEPPND